MAKAVIDSTVLISAMLKPVPAGVSHELLRFAAQGAFDLYLSDDILEETARVLLTRERLRRRYKYSEDAVLKFCRGLARLAVVVPVPPDVPAVVRDPNDDMIVACAVAAEAEFLVTRDKDLLSLAVHCETQIVSPEAFLHLLRKPQA